MEEEGDKRGIKMLTPPDIDKESFLNQTTLAFKKNQTLMDSNYCSQCDKVLEPDSPFYLIDLQRFCLSCKDRRNNEFMGVIEINEMR